MSGSTVEGLCPGCGKVVRTEGSNTVHCGPLETLCHRGLWAIGIATIFAPRIFRGFSTLSAVDTLSYKTVSVNKENADKKWLLVDAEGQRLAACSEIARLLRGKHKVNFTPHADCGDYVIVINAEKVELTGNKWEDKEYIRFSDTRAANTAAPPRKCATACRSASWRTPFAACSRRTALDGPSSRTCTFTLVPSTSTRPSNRPLTPSPPDSDADHQHFRSP